MDIIKDLDEAIDMYNPLWRKDIEYCLFNIQNQLAIANKIELEKIRRQSNIAPKANLEWSKPVSTTQIT